MTEVEVRRKVREYNLEMLLVISCIRFFNRRIFDLLLLDMIIDSNRIKGL